MATVAQQGNFFTANAGWWSRYVAPTPPGQSSHAWHVSPVIDAAAYHFSWAWVLVPMLFAAPDSSYVLIIYALMMGANLAHRHYGLPYAYLDREVRQTYRRQLTWFPLACVVMLATTPLLLRSTAAGPIGAHAVVTVIALALLWNLWHTYMQKFGILRLYSAKDPAPVAVKTPAWIDKYFLLCWFPLYFSYVGPANKDLILANTEHLNRVGSIAIAFLERYEYWLVGPSALIAAGGVGLWLWWEWRSSRLRNRARLSAAAGTLLISTAALWANPAEAVVAFAFSHAVEYMVFVWAFQRRRYYLARPVPSVMKRLLGYPKTWYVAFTAIFFAAGTIQALWGTSIIPAPNPIAFLGMTGASWFFYYAVYESLVHFYMDGFLWKMRRPEVRENI
jgi:hypothetical protein